MTYEMEYLIHLTRCGASGEDAAPPDRQLDWNKLMQLAYEQDVLYTAFVPLKKQALGCPDTLAKEVSAQFRGKALENSMRADAIMALVQQAQAEGIRLLIIKGYDIARFYTYPECRISSDTDFLVKKEDEEKALAFLQRAGFHMEPRREDSNHAVGRHPRLGVVELHINLITDRFGTTLFAPAQLNERAFENIQEVPFADSTFYALESTNALLFITFHLIKHFLFNGISLKMMFDTALYAKHTQGKTDAARYYDALEKSGYLHFVQIIFGAMVRFGGFDAADFPIVPAENEADIVALLTALERDGSMGKKNEDAALEAWMFYHYHIAKNSANKEDLALVKRETKKDYRSALFPSRAVMSEKYPVLQKHPHLYGVCWSHRFFTKGLHRLFSSQKLTKRKVSDETELSDSARERIALLKQFEIM